MRVAEAIGRELARQGLDQVFGVVGSGNFHVTNALVSAGARFVATRHEAGAAIMADAYARTTGRVAAVTVHQGCGLTNALTGIVEAAKSRTPLLVLAADTRDLERALELLHRPARRAARSRRPLGVASPRRGPPSRKRYAPSAAPPSTGAPSSSTCRWTSRTPRCRRTRCRSCPSRAGRRRPGCPVGRAAGRTPARRRSVRCSSPAAAPGCGRAGRARRRSPSDAAPCWRRRPSPAGSSPATSGPRRLGRLRPPLTAELVSSADLVVGWGAALNVWTRATASWSRPAPRSSRWTTTPRRSARTSRSTSASSATCRGRPREATAELLRARPRSSTTWRTRGAAGAHRRGARLAQRAVRRHEHRRADRPADADDRPRRDPARRSASSPPDGGNFNGYPAMFLDVPDERGYCLPLAFQSIGLGLATAIGAGVASPGRVAVAGVGDGGFMMSHVELDTAVRLGAPARGGRLQRPRLRRRGAPLRARGAPLDIVEFPETDIAAIARGYGCEAVTVRTVEDLKAVRDWVDGPRRPTAGDRRKDHDVRLLDDRPLVRGRIGGPHSGGREPRLTPELHLPGRLARRADHRPPGPGPAPPARDKRVTPDENGTT